MNRLPLIAVGVLTLASAHAQIPDREDIPNITVTADPFANRSAIEATHPTSVLSGDELDRRRAASLGATLAAEPGVHAADFAAGASRPVIRGLGGPRVRVLEDGVGVFDASIVSPDHNVSTEPFRARQIEVLKGPATLLYGSGAIGGVINVVSDLVPRTPLNGLEGSIGLRAATVDSGETVWGHAGGGNGRVAFHLDGLLRRADDYEVPGFADLDAADDPDATPGIVENSFVDSDSFGIGLGWTGDAASIGLGLSRYSTRYGVPGHGHDHADEGAEDDHGDEHDDMHGAAEAGPYIDLEQTRVLLRVERDASFGPFERLRAALTASEYQHAEIEGDEIGTVFANEAGELRIELSHRPLGAVSGVIGVQLDQQDFSALGDEAFVPPVDSRSAGLFLVEEYSFGAGRASLGLRGETVEHDPASASAREFTLFSVAGGVHLELPAQQHLRVGLSRSQRAPDVQELFASGPHLATRTFESGDAGLRTESALNLDLGLEGGRGAWHWSLNLFATRYADFIYQAEVDEDGLPGADRVDEDGQLSADGELLVVRHEQRDAEFRGAEVELKHTLFRSEGRALEVSLFGDVVHAAFAAGGAVPRVPPARIGAAWNGRDGGWRYGVDVTRVLSQDRVGRLESRTAGYTLLGAELGYLRAAGPGLITVTLRGRNLLDEEARSHLSFLKGLAPLPGRSLALDLGFEF